MLGIGLDIARSGMTATTERSTVVARNIANASNPFASRKTANVMTGMSGGALVASISRDSNEALLRGYLGASSGAAAQSTISAALDKLDQTINDPELNSSPAARISQLRDAMQVFATEPGNATLASAAVSAAKDVALSLNEASSVIGATRVQADSDMAKSVETINGLLSKFEAVDRAIVNGTFAGQDVTDQLDARDDILRGLSAELSIRRVPGGNGGMALYTDSGLTLYDTSVRAVTMQASPALPAGAQGHAVFIDGVAVTGADAPMAVAGGRLAGLAAVRDTIAPKYQSQLDELARGLIGAFAESDQSAVPTLPDIPGLFTYPGAPTMPAAATLSDGLAASISVSMSVDPTVGGWALLLRDGAIGDPGNPAYTYNASGGSAFADRIEDLISRMSSPQGFDADTGLPASADLVAAASASAGWLQDTRQSASNEADYRSAVMDRSKDALLRETGINLDDEMATMLEIERAYQTSAKLLTMIDMMFQTLLEAV